MLFFRMALMTLKTYSANVIIYYYQKSHAE